MTRRPGLVPLLLPALLLGACGTMRNVVGIVSPGEPTTLKYAEARWLLIKNPRYGSVPSEPQYIWVEEDKVPTTLTTLLRGERAIIAPPEIVAKYGPPPGGGKISPRQGVPYHVANGSSTPAARPATPPPATDGAAPGPPPPAVTRTAAAPPAAVQEPRRGMVVHLDTTRIVVDLTASDGIHPGSLLSLRRDRIPIVHPVTGEVLGELDEEVATARVVEIRDRFSVAEIETVAPGAQVQIRDRVVVK